MEDFLGRCVTNNLLNFNAVIFFKFLNVNCVIQHHIYEYMYIFIIYIYIYNIYIYINFNVFF